MKKYFTRTGDDGYTGQLGEGRLTKYHPRIEAVGTIDEAVAIIGLTRALAIDPRVPVMLLRIQRELYQAMAEISATADNALRFSIINPDHVKKLEIEISQLGDSIQVPKEFIVPGDSPNGARMAHVRTVIRRAERRVAQLIHENELENTNILAYLNRLSSLFFILELVENDANGGKPTTLAKTKDDLT